MHEHVIVRWLVLVIVVPLVLEVLLDLLRHMVMLERSKATKSLVGGLRRLLFVLATSILASSMLSTYCMLSTCSMWASNVAAST